MREDIERAAASLRSGFPFFTRRNLFHTVRRALGSSLDEAEFNHALRSCRRGGALAGLLPAPRRRRFDRLDREWAAYFPAAILLVDSPHVLRLFAASGAVAAVRMAVVALDGSPEHVVDWLLRGAKAGRRAPVLYLHDARTIAYPFAFEPLETMVRAAQTPLVYRDLGLPPLGRPAIDLGPLHPGAADEQIFELEALPPATLVAYAARAAIRSLPEDPNMQPLGESS